MSKNEALTRRQKELVAVGASVAAGCRPCATHHFDAARQEGAAEEEIRRAVECALRVRERSTRMMAELLGRSTGTARDPNESEPAGGGLVDELVSAGAALSVNWVAGLEHHLSAARRLGADDRQIQGALGVARVVKKVAAERAEAAAAQGLSLDPDAEDDEPGGVDAGCAAATGRSSSTLEERPGELVCAGLWGGTEDRDLDIRAGNLIASLYASSCDGGKGGDIHYIGVCDADQIARVALADVMGHGQAVSDVSPYMYDALRDHICDPDSGAILSEINRIAVRRGLSALTTAAIVAYDGVRRQLRISYAGHPPVLLKRAQDTDWLTVAANERDDPDAAPVAGLPLAIDAATSYGQNVIETGSGDRLVIYTDGVTEAPNAEGVQFGFQRLNAILDAHGDSPISQLKSAVLTALDQHTGGALTHDDVTLIAVEIGPHPSAG